MEDVKLAMMVTKSTLILHVKLIVKSPTVNYVKMINPAQNANLDSTLFILMES